MSDLEGTGARGQIAAPASNIAIGKLRAIRGQTLAVTQTDGLIDAFAEVFARIAASESVASNDSSGGTEVSAPVETTPIAKSGQRETERSSSLNSATRSEPNDEPTPEAVDRELEESNRDDAPVATSEGREIQEGQREESPSDDDPAQDPDLAAVDVRSALVEPERVESPDVIASETSEDQDPEGRRRDHRKADEVIPVENADQGRLGADDEKSHARQVTANGDEPVSDEELLLDSSTEIQDAETPQQVGRNRRSNASGQETRESQVAPAAREANVEQTRPTASEVGQVDAAADPPKPIDAVQAKPATKSPSAVNNIQSIVSSVARSNTAQSAQTGNPAGPRSPSQAIDLSTFRGEMASGKRPQTESKNTADTVSRVKLIQRVSKAFQHLGPDGGTVRLRLAPAEMGSVRVEMRIDQRKVQARVIAETEAVSAALREHLPELRQRLESQGMQVERIDVESEQGDAAFRERAGQHQHDDAPFKKPTWTANQIDAEAEDGDAVSPSVSQIPSTTGTNAIPLAHGGMDVRL